MVDTFTTSSTTLQSLEEIEQRAPTAGAKMWCFLSGTDPAGCAFDEVHSSNDHCVAVYVSILMRFSSFSEGIALSEVVHSSPFRR